MPPSADLREFATQLMAQLEARFPVGGPVHLEWRAYRVTAGMAFYLENRIALSDRVLLTREQVTETLIHEYAHLLAFARHGRKATGHGPAWRQAMRDLGAEPRVRHAYPVQRNQVRQATRYACLRCGVTFLRARKLAAHRRYVHRGCGGALKLVGTETITPDGGGA